MYVVRPRPVKCRRGLLLRRDERRRNLALFLHAVIGELDIEKMEPGERTERVRTIAAWYWPNLKKRA